MRGSAAAQRALVAELDQAGISALGIGLGLVFQRVPRALVEEARARSFPVFTVPLETAFRDIAGFVARSSLSGALHTYQRLTSIQRHLVDALREPEPLEAMVQRLARRLDAGVLVLDGPSAGAVPDVERVRRRVAEREFEDDGWHVVTVPIPPAGWLAVTARRRVPLARAAAQAAVPLLAATDRLAEHAREQERAVRAALLDELLDPLPPPVLEALTEFFARDQDVNAAAAALHIHPNTLRYRLGRVEALLGRSLRSPATIAELTLALSTRAA
jgi:PucR family transcriptional regulator, purine catabolism regulatory protein